MIESGIVKDLKIKENVVEKTIKNNGIGKKAISGLKHIFSKDKKKYVK